MKIRLEHTSLVGLLAVAFGAPLAQAQERGDRPWDVKRTEATPEAYVQYYLETQEGNPWSWVFTGSCPSSDPWRDEARALLLELPLPPESKRSVAMTAVIGSAASCKHRPTQMWLMERIDDLTLREKVRAVEFAAKYGGWDFFDRLVERIEVLPEVEQESILHASIRGGGMELSNRFDAFFRLWDHGVMPPGFAVRFSQRWGHYADSRGEFVRRVLEATTELDRKSAYEVVLGLQRGDFGRMPGSDLTQAEAETLKERYEELRARRGGGAPPKRA